MVESLVQDLAIWMSAFREREQEFIVFMDNPKTKFEELEATMGSLHPLVSRIAEYFNFPGQKRKPQYCNVHEIQFRNLKWEQLAQWI